MDMELNLDMIEPKHDYMKSPGSLRIGASPSAFRPFKKTEPSLVNYMITPKH